METAMDRIESETLDSKKLEALNLYIDGQEDKEKMLIHILHRGQHLFGYLPPSLQLHIARRTGLPASKVFGVVTFYSYFTETMRGKHTISVCMGTACFVKGANGLTDHLRRSLLVSPGGTTKDGMFTLNEIRCIGACGLAPAVMVDDKVYGHMNPRNVDKVVDSYRGKEEDHDSASQ